MKKSLRDKIYKKLKAQITQGVLSPGERLIEDRLAKEFKASRSPIREALRLLESEGFLTFERNRGISVAKLSIKQVEEIYELRWLLEGHAALITAAAVTPQDIIYLKGLQKNLRMAAAKGDINGWLENNSLFHNFFYENCGNSKLIAIVDNLKRNVYRYYFVTLTVPWHFSTYLDHHEGILQACIKKDGEMAKEYMQLHLEHIKVALIKQLKNERKVAF